MPEKLTLDAHTALKNGEILSAEQKLKYTYNKKPIWMQVIIKSTITENGSEYFQITLQDVSQRRFELNALNEKAYKDKLTGLLNRRGVEQEIQSLILAKKPFMLALLDLNKFKPINDQYGHDSGDRVLIHTAHSFKQSFRKIDIISRWGGDEFVILMQNINKKDTQALLLKMTQNLSRPFYITGVESTLSIGVSYGAASFPEDGETLDTLIKVADKAMYSMK